MPINKDLNIYLPSCDLVKVNRESLRWRVEVTTEWNDIKQESEVENVCDLWIYVGAKSEFVWQARPLLRAGGK